MGMIENDKYHDPRCVFFFFGFWFYGSIQRYSFVFIFEWLENWWESISLTAANV